MPLGSPSILEASLNRGLAPLPRAVALATSSLSSRINRLHLTPRRVHIHLSTTGGQVRFLLALVLPVPIRKRVNLFRLLVLQHTAMGALQVQGPLPQARVGYPNLNPTRLAAHRVLSLRLLPVAVPRPRIPSLKATTHRVQLQRTRTHSLLPRLQLPTPILRLKVLRSGGHKRLHAHL